MSYEPAEEIARLRAQLAELKSQCARVHRVDARVNNSLRNENTSLRRQLEEATDSAHFNCLRANSLYDSLNHIWNDWFLKGHNGLTFRAFAEGIGGDIATLVDEHKPKAPDSRV